MELVSMFLGECLRPSCKTPPCFLVNFTGEMDGMLAQRQDYRQIYLSSKRMPKLKANQMPLLLFLELTEGHEGFLKFERAGDVRCTSCFYKTEQGWANLALESIWFSRVVLHYPKNSTGEQTVSWNSNPKLQDKNDHCMSVQFSPVSVPNSAVNRD